MGIETAVIAGSAALGAMSSAKGKKQTSSSTMDPWAPQAPYLTNGFQYAQDIYDASKGSPWYQGDLYTGINDIQREGIGYGLGYARDYAAPMLNGAYNAATSGMGNASTFGTNAANFASGNFGTTSGANPALMSGMTDFAQGALGQAGSFQGNLDAYMRGAQGDPTQANIAAATSYMNSPLLQAQIDAAGADVTHQLGTGLVGLNNAASAGGNLNSSRAGAAEAAMRGEAARTIGTLSSTMRGNAYNQGLQLAESARGTNLGAQATGLGTQAGYIGQGLNTGQGLLGLGENQRQFDTSARLQGNAQLGQSAQLGYQGAQVAQGIGQDISSTILGAGQVLQDDANNQNAANYQAWLGNDQRATDLLQRYWSIIGRDGFGKSETSTSTQPGLGFWGGALGGAAAGAGIMGSFGNAPAYGGTGAGRMIRGSTGMLGGGV